MAKKKITPAKPIRVKFTVGKKAKKTTRKERSEANKAEHARKQALEASARARKTQAKKEPKVIPYPEAGRKVTEFEQELDRQLGSEAPAGAKPTGTEAQPEIIKFDYIVIAQVCQIPFDLWSISQGVEQLKLSDKEARLMAKPAKELLDYYLPQIPVIAWAWISLAVVSYSALKSRLLIIQEIKKQVSLTEPAAEARGKSASNVSPGPQGHGGPPPSGNNVKFPTREQLKTQVV